MSEVDEIKIKSDEKKGSGLKSKKRRFKFGLIPI